MRYLEPKSVAKSTWFEMLLVAVDIFVWLQVGTECALLTVLTTMDNGSLKETCLSAWATGSGLLADRYLGPRRVAKSTFRSRLVIGSVRTSCSGMVGKIAGVVLMVDWALVLEGME